MGIRGIFNIISKMLTGSGMVDFGLVWETGTRFNKVGCGPWVIIWALGFIY